MFHLEIYSREKTADVNFNFSRYEIKSSMYLKSNDEGSKVLNQF